MVQNAYLVDYLLAKIDADTAENERDFAEILPKIANYLTGPLPSRRDARVFEPRHAPDCLERLRSSSVRSERAKEFSAALEKQKFDRRRSSTRDFVLKLS